MDHPLPRRLTRRGFLVASAGLAAAACSSANSTATSTGDAITSFESTEPAFLQAAFPAGNRQPTILATGSQQRAIFGLTRGTGYLQADDVPVEIELALTDPSGTTVEVDLPRRSEQIPLHYYPLIFTPTQAGVWRIAGTFEGNDIGVDFTVADPTEVPLIQVGQPMPALDTPTFDNSRGVDPICTRSPEPCAFHDLTLAQALSQGGPTALMISTPGFCQTGICGPTLEIMTAELANYGDYSVVHAEVYNDPQKLGVLPPNELLTDTVQTFGMAFEPSLIIADDDGTVAARLDVTMDAVEIRAALQAGLA